MSKLLNGKIYWVQDDFKHNNKNYYPKEGETLHVAADLRLGIIKENMIKFQTDSFASDGTAHVIEANLLNTGINLFKGDLTFQNDHLGRIECELFENSKSIFLYGIWEEEEIIFTFWARIDKK